MDDDDELTAYETGHEQDPAPWGGSVPIHGTVNVDGPVVTVHTVPQHVSTYTVVVDADGDQPWDELLPLDPLRVRAVVVVHDQPVVLCSTRAQAQDIANRQVGTPYPAGMFVPASISVEVTHIDRMFVAATAGGGSATRVSVLVERRTPV